MSLKKARRQPPELMQLIEMESYGYKRDEKEKMDRLEAENAQAIAEAEAKAYDG